MPKLSTTIRPVCDVSRFRQINGQTSTKMANAISAVKAQITKLPHVDKSEILTYSTIHNNELNPLSKKIELVLNEMRVFIKNMGSSNASIRPSANECKSMHEDLKKLKDSIIEYKKSALSITNYKHNTKKTDKINSLISESIQLENKLNKNLNKNKELQKKVVNELNKSAREMEERAIRKNDIQNNH